MATLAITQKQEQAFENVVEKIRKNPEDLAKFLYIFLDIRVLRHTMERMQTPVEYKDTPLPKFEFEHPIGKVTTHDSAPTNQEYKTDSVVVGEVNPATGQSTSETRYTRANTANEVRDRHFHITEWIARVQTRYAKVGSCTKLLRNEGDTAFVHQFFDSSSLISPNDS